jgi:hypothetical protein
MPLQTHSWGSKKLLFHKIEFPTFEPFNACCNFQIVNKASTNINYAYAHFRKYVISIKNIYNFDYGFFQGKIYLIKLIVVKTFCDGRGRKTQKQVRSKSAPLL